MPKLTMTVPVTIHFDWDIGQGPTAVIPSIQPSLTITNVHFPGKIDLEEWLWEAKDEWEED